MAAALPASVDIMQYDSVIFDLDHTLIRYNLHPLFELIFDSLRQFLVDVRYDFEVVFLASYTNLMQHTVLGPEITMKL